MASKTTTQALDRIIVLEAHIRTLDARLAECHDDNSLYMERIRLLESSLRAYGLARLIP